MDLNLSITNGIVSSKIYDKRDDFNFEIVNFSFVDRDAGSPSYGVFCNLFVLCAYVLMSMPSTSQTHFLLLNY